LELTDRLDESYCRFTSNFAKSVNIKSQIFRTNPILLMPGFSNLNQTLMEGASCNDHPFHLFNEWREQRFNSICPGLPISIWCPLSS